MLNFFRKYQKFFFVIVTVFVVISFSFFGTFSTLSQTDGGEPDRTIGKALDGSPITARQLDTMVRLLGSSFEARTSAPNLLNDGVIRKEFLGTGMSSLLAQANFEQITKDLAPRLRKARHYKPYVHPKAPFISAEMTWQQYFPGMNRDLAILREAGDEPTIDDFNLLVRLYLAQLQLPPDSLKQMLLYQQNHFQNLPPDPTLQRQDLALFGFHTLDDWFGPEYLQLACRFIINAAAEARSKGYSVSYDEARAALMQNVHAALSYYGQKDEDIGRFYQDQLRMLQINETSAVKAWRDVMLFRRLFHDVGNAAVIDPFIYESFGKYAKEGVAVEVYEFPQEFRLDSALTALSLQTYLEAISPDGTAAALPGELLAAELVEKRYPELVQRHFELEMKEIKREDLRAQISLKETWDWELAEENREILEREFGDLFTILPDEEEERFELLEQLKSEDRLRVDQFAREQIALAHPEWIDQAFDAAEAKQTKIAIRAKGETLPFEGIHNSEYFEQLLLAALPGNEGEGATAARTALQRYTEDGNRIYAINVFSASPQKELLTFKEAQEKGALRSIVEARLEKAYPKARRQEAAPFQNEDGSWRLLQEVKEEVARIAFPRLADEALKRFVEQAREELVQNPESLAWVQDELSKGDSAAQWRLVKRKQIITRASQDPLFSENLVNTPVGEWTVVVERESGDPCVVHVVEKVEGTHLEEALDGQSILSIGARRYLMSKLLDQMSGHEL